jgi:hypothetical protein
MSRGQCNVCAHPERAAIDVGLVEGRSKLLMAKHFGISHHSLWRHWYNHVPAQARASMLATRTSYAHVNLDEMRVNETEGLLANAVELRRRFYENGERAEAVGDFRAAVLCYGKILEVLTFIGKLLNQFSGHHAQQVNQLVVSPDYLRLRAALITALQPYPEARAAVARVLRDLETVEVESNGAAQ